MILSLAIFLTFCTENIMVLPISTGLPFCKATSQSEHRNIGLSIFQFSKFSFMFLNTNNVFQCESNCSNSYDLDPAGVYRRSIFEIRPNILIGLQKLRLRPKDRSRSRLFIYLIFLLRQFS